jgi:hypothetical protein
MKNKKYATMADYKSGNYSDKLFLFQWGKTNNPISVQTAEGNPVIYPSKAPFYLTDEIMDGDILRSIRYSQGVTSIFSDEQPEEAKVDSNGRAKKRYKVIFKDGTLILEGTNKLVIDFMMKTNHNGANVNRDTGKSIKFNFIDKSGGFQKDIDNDKLKQKAASWCYNANFTDVQALARVLMKDSMKDMDSEEIRWNLKKIAELDPKKFLEDTDSDIIKRKNVFYEAIDRGILKVDQSQNTLAWAENPSQPIFRGALNADIIDVALSGSTTPEGEVVFAAIREQVMPKPQPAQVLNTTIPDFKKKEPVAEPLVKMTEEGYSEIKSIYDNAVEEGIIEVAGAWRKYGDFKFNGERAFLTNLRANQEVLDSLKEALEEA